MKKLSQEHKKKISESLKGRTLSKEHRYELAKAHKGKILSKEHKRKLSESHKGQIPWNKGISLPKQSEESNRKRSESLKGRIGHPMSEEHKRKLFMINNGKKLSQETIEKRTQSRAGYKHSPETIEKIRSSNLGQKRKPGPVKAATKQYKAGYYGIPTFYNGVYMRSRTEAMCAQALDFCGIIWNYEPERFYLNEIDETYIPDFYLPEFDIWLEVKWDRNDLKLYKAYALRRTGKYLTVVTRKDIEDVYKIYAIPNVLGTKLAGKML